MVVYDLKTLAKISEYYFTEPVATKLLSWDDKRLMVLLSDQALFQLEIGDLSKADGGK